MSTNESSVAAGAGTHAGGELMAVLNPATGARIGEVPVMGPDEVRAAVRRARQAQGVWAALPVAERAARLRRWRDQVIARTDEVVDLLVAENGKTRSEALGMELMTWLNLTTYHFKHAPKILAPESRSTSLLVHRKSYVEWYPRGVVGIISPWNYPWVIPLGEAALALLAGNAVVVKPSEHTPLIVLLARRLFEEAGLPPELFQVVTGRGPTGAALIEADPDMIVFTGSVAAGRKVAEACGRRLIPCTLELGGKAPAVVLADADLERTARALTWGAFANSGQTCIAVERVYAEGPIYAPLVERVAALTRELRQGNPAGDVDVGAMTFAGQLDVVESQVADARARGARVLTGGKRGVAGQFFEPTVIADCTHEMAVMREETFGPLLPFMQVRDAEEAVQRANDSHLGLNAYVFTASRERGRELAERIRAGQVVINDVLSNYAIPTAPFGGVKASGLGRVHGPEGLRSFCELRHVSYDRFRPPGGRELWWYPYSPRTYRLLRRGLELLFKGK